MPRLTKPEEMVYKTVASVTYSEDDEGAILGLTFTDDTQIMMEFSIEQPDTKSVGVESRPQPTSKPRMKISIG